MKKLKAQPVHPVIKTKRGTKKEIKDADASELVDEGEDEHGYIVFSTPDEGNVGYSRL